MRVFEYGIVARDQSAPEGLKLIATDEMPSYSRFSLTLVDESGRSLNQRLAYVLTVGHAHKVADYYEESDARYALRSCAYHLERIATYYSEHTQFAEQQERMRKARGQDPALMIATDDQRVYFEIDAFLGSARRFYEQLRKVLWKHGGQSANRPQSFPKVLKAVRLPPDYIETLDESWSEYGQKLKGYRDSVFHYDPLNEGHTNVRMRPVGNRWGLILRLPENPEAKSRSSFRFEDGPDALSYGYGLLCHLAAIADRTHQLLGFAHPRYPNQAS